MIIIPIIFILLPIIIYASYRRRHDPELLYLFKYSLLAFIVNLWALFETYLATASSSISLVTAILQIVIGLLIAYKGFRFTFKQIKK